MSACPECGFTGTMPGKSEPGHFPRCSQATMPELPDAAITAAAWAIHNERVYHASQANLCTCKKPPDWDLRAAQAALEAAAPALIAQGVATERAEADLRIADAVATEFCRIRALAKKVGAVYPNPGADRGPLRESLRRPPYLPFVDLLDADRPEDDATCPGTTGGDR